MKKEEFEAKHGKLGGNVLYIDLDEQQEPPEVTTAGWTDSQLRAKPIEEIDKMIASGEMGLVSLEETIAQERERVEGLKLVRLRKLQL